MLSTTDPKQNRIVFFTIRNKRKQLAGTNAGDTDNEKHHAFRAVLAKAADLQGSLTERGYRLLIGSDAFIPLMQETNDIAFSIDRICGETHVRICINLTGPHGNFVR